ncbi:hypothetical protein KAR91_46980 [Candidatus Pacearchaeota archaeon]|nr:hypothetical protein [Candidatus Pacearchaeota archaeon]
MPEYHIDPEDLSEDFGSPPPTDKMMTLCYNSNCHIRGTCLRWVLQNKKGGGYISLHMNQTENRKGCKDRIHKKWKHLYCKD